MESVLKGYFESLKGKRVAVIGLGVSNKPLVDGLLDAGVPVLVCDRRGREDFNGLIERLERRGMTAALGPGYLDQLEGADVIFRTPGLRPDVPQIARRHGGNIGHPLLCQLDGIRPDDMVVLELSSFQLMTVRQSPSIAVVTNLAPNHLDVHRDMEEYVAAKRNIFAYQDACDRLVLNADNEITAGFAKEARGAVTLFSRKKTVADGVYLRDKTVVCHGRPVLDAGDILLPGLHNLENYMAAIAAVDGLVPDEVIRDFARTFGGVAHRIELVRELDGVRYYNDSIASSPSRTTAGLRSFAQKVILIAGGYDKHIPYDALGPEIVEHVKALLLTGDTAEKIKAAVLAAAGCWSGVPEIVDCAGLEEAVERSRALAVPGDVVILSPASASFDRFKNFEERGNRFKELVNALN